MAAALVAATPLAGSQSAAQAAAPGVPSVTFAVLPPGTEPSGLGRVEGVAPGVASAGLSRVSATQTFLDIGQGNRVFTSLYDEEPPIVIRFGGRVPGWQRIVRRAEGAPAEIVPGLLGSTLREAGVPVRADSVLVTPALVAADRQGTVRRTRPLRCLRRRCPGLTIVPARLRELPRLVRRLREGDLLIALERPPPPQRTQLAIGIAGIGFEGNLRSDSTRTRGYVVATDIAPTILRRFGIATPDEMGGEPIGAEGGVDAGAVGDLAARLEVVAPRRGPVVLANLLIWAALAAAAAVATRGRAARVALSLLGLSVVYLPVMLLVAAPVAPSELGERLIVGLGAPVLAALTSALVRGWAGLALACAVTVGAYAIDVIAGSPLSSLSLLGPNPGLGVRFFGIGNELEAALAVLVPVAAGAALTAAWPRLPESRRPRLAVAGFLLAGGLATALFAAGRFGADVGAAIVFPAGAAVAAVIIAGAHRSRWLLLLLAAAPIAGLAALAAIDLALGGDSHLSRSVFEAGGASEVADVAERRLRLSAKSFDRQRDDLLLWVAVAAIALLIWRRRAVLEWFRGAPAAGAGFAGAAAAMALGTVANDSGATFLIVGVTALLACLGFAWSQHQPAAAQQSGR